MTEPQLTPINETANQPVTQAEFESTMTAIKRDLDQTATKEDMADLKGDAVGLKEDVANLKEDMANLTEDVAGLRTTTEMLQRNSERMLELIEGIDIKLKPLSDLPERMRRVEKALFH